MKTHSTIHRSRGFTLIEIMVVILIIGVLAALIVPKVMSRPDEARITAAKQDIATITQALNLYKLDNGHYPTTEQGLAALVKKPTDLSYPDQLEKRRLSGPCAERSMGHALPIPAARCAWRDRCVQLRRGQSKRR